MRMKIRTLHRWLSLGALSFWLLQALSGAFLVFHWEIDDAQVEGPVVALDVALFELAIRALESERPGLAVSSVWATAGTPGRFDITVTDPGNDSAEVLRVDGRGTVLRRRSADETWQNGAWIKTVASFHQTLLAGETGHYLIGISGLLLLSNIVLGLTLAWPARGQWRRTLLPAKARDTAANLYGWHRATGLWIAPLALLTVSCGTLLIFEDAVGEWLGAESYVPQTSEQARELAADGSARITPAVAIGTAFARYPGAELAGIRFPDAESPWYRIRVLQQRELRRVFGTTTVFVGATSGQVIGDFNALDAPPARKFMDTLFPIHTGEAGGTIGRLIVLTIGLWLITMIGLGVALWWTRRRPGKP